MDQFAVIKQYSTMSPDVVFTCNNVADATAYANIMRRKNDGYKYWVFQLNEQL